MMNHFQVLISITISSFNYNFNFKLRHYSAGATGSEDADAADGVTAIAVSRLDGREPLDCL